MHFDILPVLVSGVQLKYFIGVAGGTVFLAQAGDLPMPPQLDSMCG